MSARKLRLPPLGRPDPKRAAALAVIVLGPWLLGAIAAAILIWPR